MSMIDLKHDNRESSFTFDVWCCPDCNYVLSIEEYRQTALNF